MTNIKSSRVPRFGQRRIAAAVLLVLVLPFTATAQGRSSLADRVHDAPNGTVRFSFAARPGVCGTGNSVHIGNGNSSVGWNGNSPDVEWDDDCGRGPVRVVLNIQDHTVSGLRTYVGGRWRAAHGVTDLGNIASRTASDYLISLARTAPASVGHNAIFPATLGDSVTIWPSLMQIARNAAVPSATRRDAVFWLGQMAGDAVTANLAQLVTEDTLDREVRESAVFALSQRPRDEGVPALIHVARTNRDPAVRRKALFWLGQSNDPRALALFEAILAGNGKS